MSRSLTAGVEAEIAKNIVTPIFLVMITTSGGDVFLWSGIGDLVWDGDTYVGAGQLGGVSEVRETTDVEATGLRFSLSGVDSALIAVALGSIRQGLPAKLWLGFLDSTPAIIADPVLLWEGFTDVPEINELGETATISITSEGRMIELDRARTRRYTDQDQKQDDATDLGFEFVPSLQDKQIVFGGTAVAGNLGSSGKRSRYRTV